MQRRSSSTKQKSRRVPVRHQPAPSGSRQGGRGSELSPATPPPRRRPRWGVLGTTAAIFFLCVRYILDMWKTRKKKWRERIYLYFCTEETHELRHYWCSVYTQTRCRASFFGAWCRFRPPGTASRIRRAELFFPSSSSFAFVRQKCVLVPFRRTHSTQSREHRKLFCDGAALQRGAGSQLFIHSIRVSSFENSFRSHFSFLHPPPPSASSSFFALWVLDDCQLWIDLRKKMFFV